MAPKFEREWRVSGRGAHCTGISPYHHKGYKACRIRKEKFSRQEPFTKRREREIQDVKVDVSYEAP